MQKGFHSIVIIIGILLIILIAGTVYYFKTVRNTNPSQTTQSSQTSQPESLTSFQDETANWELYTNQKFGFSLKHPKDWIVKENDSNIIWVSNTKNEILIIGVKNVKDSAQIIHPGNTNTKNLIKRGSVDFLQQPVEKDVLVLEGDDRLVIYDQGKEISRGNLVFSLSLDKAVICPASTDFPCPKTLSPEAESTADKILSTFALLNQN